ncbi:MAG: hypothetical protein NOU37_02210 [Candidatus Brocadiales bacterium]|nr:hypothetical protein [Candidatus Bathyanammoxibius amoris]
MVEKTENKEKIRLITVVREDLLLRQRDVYPKEEKVDTWPHLVKRELIAVLAASIVVVAWSLLQNAPLEELANPNETPKLAKAPWYFVGLQELLVYFDPWMAGVVLPTVILVGLALIPYIDPDPIKGVGRYNVRTRKFASACFIGGFTMWFVLVIVGQYFRGPFWNFYWPGESWDVIKPMEQALGSFPLPAGIAFLVCYGALMLILPAILFPKFFFKLGLIRYFITMNLFAAMLFVPIKILLRVVFNVKYVLVTPWFNI